MLSQHISTVYPSGDIVLAVRPKPRAPKPDNAPPDSSPPMGLSDATISQINPKPLPTKRSKKGLLGINPHGKRMLRSSGAVLAKLFPPDLTTFCTVTTPTITPEENLILNPDYSNFVREVIQFISNRLKAHGISADITYTIEIQEDRWVNDGIVGLHIHAVFQGRKAGQDWVIKREDIDAEVKRLYEKRLGRSVDVRACNELGRAKGRLDKEIGKYLSKGGQLTKQIPPELLPTAWWGMTKSLKAKILAAIIVFRDSTATWLWDNIADFPILYRLVRLSEQYGNYVIAKVGFITSRIFLDQLTNIASTTL